MGLLLRKGAPARAGREGILETRRTKGQGCIARLLIVQRAGLLCVPGYEPSANREVHYDQCIISFNSPKVPRELGIITLLLMIWELGLLSKDAQRGQGRAVIQKKDVWFQNPNVPASFSWARVFSSDWLWGHVRNELMTVWSLWPDSTVNRWFWSGAFAGQMSATVIYLAQRMWAHITLKKN